jgi:hypothetical protein
MGDLRSVEVRPASSCLCRRTGTKMKSTVQKQWWAVNGSAPGSFMSVPLRRVSGSSCRDMRNYPTVDRGNDFLISRFDGALLDAQPWGRGGDADPEKAQHRPASGAARSDAAAAAEAPETAPPAQAAALRLLHSLEVRGPLSSARRCCVCQHAVVGRLLLLYERPPWWARRGHSGGKVWVARPGTRWHWHTLRTTRHAAGGPTSWSRPMTGLCSRRVRPMSLLQCMPTAPAATCDYHACNKCCRGAAALHP